MRVCAVAESDHWRWQPLDETGKPRSAPRSGSAGQLLAALPGPTDRLILPDVARDYPRLRAGGGRVARCHDLALVEALLLGSEGLWGHPRSLAAAWARLHGAPVPEDPLPPANREPEGLFTSGQARGTSPLAGNADPLTAGVAVHADQLARIDRAREHSPGFGLLAAVESAAALSGVELSEVGLPWQNAVHDQILTRLLGPRPSHGGRPARLQELAEQIAVELGDPRLNPDSQPELLRALRRAGIEVVSTRRSELRQVDHPVIAMLLRYRELARLHAANGWAWQRQWVRAGRFHPEYVPAAVVSGRWASRGGGALQIPRAVRAAVVAPPGRRLVIADAGQLEPRVLAALSADPGLVAATAEGDLYAALAARALGGREARDHAKTALLAAMYGGGAAGPALAALRSRFPAALELLEVAARTGEAGGSVRSVLGRASPAAGPDLVGDPTPQPTAALARRRGRFTRNFVIQASAADWASVLLADLRTRLAALTGPDHPHPPDVVFFQHDEVMVETPPELTDAVIGAITAAGDTATGWVLGRVGVRVPLQAVAVACYADKP